MTLQRPTNSRYIFTRVFTTVHSASTLQNTSQRGSLLDSVLAAASWKHREMSIEKANKSIKNYYYCNRQIQTF